MLYSFVIIGNIKHGSTVIETEPVTLFSSAVSNIKNRGLTTLNAGGEVIKVVCA